MDIFKHNIRSLLHIWDTKYDGHLMDYGTMKETPRLEKSCTASRFVHSIPTYIWLDSRLAVRRRIQRFAKEEEQPLPLIVIVVAASSFLTRKLKDLHLSRSFAFSKSPISLLSRVGRGRAIDRWCADSGPLQHTYIVCSWNERAGGRGFLVAWVGTS